MATDLVALNVGQWDMKLMSAKQHYSALSLDPERGDVVPGESDQSSTSCMRDASATEKRRKRSRIGDGDARTEVWRKDQGA